MVWLDLPISDAGETYLFYVAMSCPHGVLPSCRCPFCCRTNFDVTMLEPLGNKLWLPYFAGVLGVSMGGSLKNQTGPLILRVLFEGCKKWPLKTKGGTLTLEIFRVLNFDDFISYSSYTIKIYMKNMGGSARNSIVEKLAFLGSKGPPLGCHFFDGWNFL